MGIGRANRHRCELCRFRMTAYPLDDHASPGRPRDKGTYGRLRRRFPFRTRYSLRYICPACRPRYDAIRAAALPAMAGYLEWLDQAPPIGELPGEPIAEWHKGRMRPDEPFVELVDADWVAEALARLGVGLGADLDLGTDDDGNLVLAVPATHRDALTTVTRPRGPSRGLVAWQGERYVWQDIEGIGWLGSVYRWPDGRIVLVWRAGGLWRKPDYL